MTHEPLDQVLVIGLGHKARHGKDTVARLVRRAVIQQTQADAVTLTFSGDLKATARAMFGMMSKNGALLQTLGTEVFRAHVNPDIWVNCFAAQVYDLARDLAPDDRLVILVPDVRFPNELATIKALGGITVRVTRYNADGTVYSADDGRQMDHVSETSLNDAEFDMDIRAPSGDFAALNAGRDRILTAIMQWLVRTPEPERKIGFLADVSAGV